MRGERLAWFMLAHKLHRPLQETQQLTTSTEFLDWVTFYEIENDRENKQASRDQHYLAKVCMHLEKIFNLLIQKKVEIKLDDFLIEFGKSEEDLKEMEAKKQAAKSKSVWAGFLGQFTKKKKNG